MCYIVFEHCQANAREPTQIRLTKFFLLVYKLGLIIWFWNQNDLLADYVRYLSCRLSTSKMIADIWEIAVCKESDFINEM
jgi:hypothetical protein